MQKPLLRRATSADTGELVALIREFADFLGAPCSVTESDVLNQLFSESPSAAATLVLDSQQELAGYALWNRGCSSFSGTSYIWIEDLWIRAAFRGRGFGRATVEYLKEQSPGKVAWSIRPWNEKARLFYESLGAQRDEDLLYYLS